MSTRSGIIFTLVVCLLVVWSYYARPIYDYLWISMHRASDAVAEKIEPTATSQPYDDVIALNTQTVAQTEAFISSLRAKSAQAPELTSLNFSSPEAYQASTGPLRASLEKALGLPLADAFHGADFSTVKQTPLGDDDIATYTLLSIPALPGLDLIGTLIEPKKHEAVMPLIIANHGRGDMPERPASGKISVMSYSSRDLGRGAVERGWAVFEPMYLFYGKDYPENIRDVVSVRAEEAGTTLPAIEITKLIRGIDYLVTRPELDSQRLAMVGMSYGGFYTLYTTALDARIKVAVAAAYFNDRAGVLDSSEPFGFFDWRYSNSVGLFTDDHIVALICPRPLQIQSGTQDQLFPIEGSRKTIPAARTYYTQLHLDADFEFKDFTGRHDFDSDDAWDFVARTFAAPGK